MTTFKKISVITPNYNGALFLEKTISSVLDQNYPNLEYIIIDGGSTDRSLDIIKKYEKDLAYWVSEKDNGLYYALNKGFRKANGEILMYINSDDKLVSGSLAMINKLFSKYPDILWLTGYYTWLNEDDEVTRIERNKNWSVIDFVNGEYQWIQQESTVWRKEIWEMAGARFNTDYKYAGDLALWSYFFLYSNPVIADISIGAFRIRKNQLSQNYITEYNQEAKFILEDLKKKLPKSTLKAARTHKLLNFLIQILKKSAVFDNNRILKILATIKLKLRRKSERVIYIGNAWQKKNSSEFDIDHNR